MLKFLFHILTGVDGATFDIGRVFIALSCLVGLSLEIYSVVLPEHKFDIQAFGIGMGSLLMGGGGMLFAKRETEPSCKEQAK